MTKRLFIEIHVQRRAYLHFPTCMLILQYIVNDNICYVNKSFICCRDVLNMYKAILFYCYQFFSDSIKSDSR